MKTDWIKSALLGGVVGAIGFSVVGFQVFGWTLGSTADEMARDAKIAALAPICMSQAQEDPEYTTKLAALKEEGKYSRDDFVEDAGWATFQGSDVPNALVADRCAELLSELET